MKIKIILLSIIMSNLAFAQHPLIDDLVKLGLKENLGLKQQNFAFQESLKRLSQAKGQLLPSINISARYSRAGGGRMIGFPVGDLMNPVYQTLNQYLALAGEPATFPENLPNIEIPFLRKKEQETKLTLIQPIFQPAIWHNINLHNHMAKIKKLEKQTFARELAAEIKIAYFNALKAHHAKLLFEKTISVLTEHVRVNQKLFDQDKVIRAVVWRAKAEKYSLDQNLIEAEKDAKLALAYLNFLLNRDQTTTVEFINQKALPGHNILSPKGPDAIIQAINTREELKQLNLAILIAGDKKALAGAGFLPTLTLVADYGIQGTSYRIDKDADYWMGSMVLSWNIFKGFQDRNQLQEAELLRKRIKTQKLEAESQIRLQVVQILEELAAAQSAVAATEAGEKAAQEAFRAYQKQYVEGMASQLEFLDAQNQTMQAGVQAIAARADLLIKQACLERVIAAYPLPERIR
ncbi:TolC family protein [bacterium]|nr:TolC family protein [bacterium]